MTEAYVEHGGVDLSVRPEVVIGGKTPGAMKLYLGKTSPLTDDARDRPGSSSYATTALNLWAEQAFRSAPPSSALSSTSSPARCTARPPASEPAQRPSGRLPRDRRDVGLDPTAIERDCGLTVDEPAWPTTFRTWFSTRPRRAASRSSRRGLDRQTMVDFRKRLGKGGGAKPVDPIELYEGLDRASGKGPLWPAQRAVLTE